MPGELWTWGTTALSLRVPGIVQPGWAREREVFEGEGSSGDPGAFCMLGKHSY